MCALSDDGVHGLIVIGAAVFVRQFKMPYSGLYFLQ